MIELIIKKPQNIKNDILSGITVALALVPEAIAFSFVAHVDPKVGLYAAFMMGLITAVFGGRPGMISGATGAVAVIFAPLVIAQTKLHGADAALNYLFLAVALMGIIQIAFGALKFGKFIRLIPHPVMLGFVNGLAIIIFKAQFSQFYVGTGETARLIATQPLTIMIGLIILTMGIIHYLPRFTKAIPATLVAILTVTGISLFLKSHGFEIHTVIDFIQNMDPSKTTIAASLPSFQIPTISLAAIKTVLPYAVLAASVGLIESLMTLTLVDELTETRGRGNKESIGQGLANVVNGLFGGMGGCAMIGQSMINIRAGGRGRLSGVTAALSLLAFFLFGAVLIEAIPLAALIGVMFMVSVATFEWSSFRILKRIPRSDAFVIFIVSATTVVVDLAVAVFVGVIISALVFAWEQGKKIHATMDINHNGHKIYKLKGSLFFGSASSFKELFTIQQDPEHIVIDFRNARVYDHSGLEAIQNIALRYGQSDKKLHLLNLSKECRDLLNKAENIIEVSIIKNLNWHLAEDKLA
ncbi:SulP family inorganic anion transporter [bacterium]|jgi:sulfate permease, SulP family|nr:SulP family inorganic anion transporter [bacterium]